MILFRDFSESILKIFSGNVLMLITIGLYITWWTISFRPNTGNQKSISAWILLALTLLSGLAAIAVLSLGIFTQSINEDGKPLFYILLTGVVAYVILAFITKFFLQRPITSELLLIIVWVALEASVISVLAGSARFGAGQSFVLTILLLFSAVVGLVCYILHYRLNETSAFWNGLYPLILDAGFVAVFLGMLAFSW